ncbi:MAG: ferritin-like domain-containing protein [Solirubrobacterales bacterium]
MEQHHLGLRSGSCRGIFSAAALLSCVALLIAGCGARGHGAETDSDKASDAAILNGALARELTTGDLYGRAMPVLHGRLHAAGREFHAQEAEYVDAITKAIRGLGGEISAEREAVDLSHVRGEAQFLALLYEREGEALASYLGAAPHLFTTAPRALVTALAAGHAEHLVILRQALGAGLAASVPEAFDSGEIPPPVTTDRRGTG